MLARARVGLLCAAVLGASTFVGLPPEPAGAAGSTITVAPDADATVSEAAPTKNFGGAGTLQTDSQPTFESYLRFTVTGLSGAVTSAKLRLRAVNGSGNGPAAYAAGAGWTETGLTWATRPAWTSSALDDAGKVKA
ncbi:MAG TPA: DNRLRE domain-containing protein, partial [Acidimicrobiia bacterium]|nr:DNRLRE domain-containing protein [Acidimicrobiia bacterium]